MTKLFDFPVRNRFSGEIQFTAKIALDENEPFGLRLGAAVKWAVNSRADLSGAHLSGADLSRANLSGAYLSRANLSRANLSRADLSGADLSGADLSGAYLSGAHLSRANLSGAYLSGAYLSRADLSGAHLSRANLSRADLSGADLSGADLSGAHLSRANLSGAYLSRANLSRADLSGADLSGADLSGAYLSDEQLRAFKADLWLTLSMLGCGAQEAQHLIAKLEAGQVDGGTYGNADNECACLVGTVAQARGLDGEDLDHNSDRPAERWFMMIEPGDKPGAETGGGYAAQKALEWTREWCAAHGVEPVPVEATADA